MRDRGTGTTRSGAPDVVVNFDEPRVIVRVMLTSDRAIDDYLDDLRRQRYSERTINTYRRILDEFADRLPRDYDVSKITVDDVRRFLATKSHLAIGTIAHAEAVLSSWFRWMFHQHKIAANPIDRLQRTKRIPAEDLDVVTVDSIDVPRLLEVARPGTERNAVAIASYLGPRRHAIALLRRPDYDQERRLMRFREKGSKMIVKPVPDELAIILDASLGRGEIKLAPYDYLVPPEGYVTRKGDRDDRVIWRVIKRVADHAGVDAHVHALRAAFACFYLERNPDDLLGLKELLGHRSLNTTLVYLRRLNKQVAMERVRSLSWATTSGGDGAAWLTGSPPTVLAATGLMGAGGFEPPSDDSRLAKPHSSQLDATRAARAAADLRRQLDPDPVGMPDAETSEASSTTTRAES